MKAKLVNEGIGIAKVKKTPYEWWRLGTPGFTGFGSFHTALLQLYKLADTNNMKKLEDAFPEWFVDKVEK